MQQQLKIRKVAGSGSESASRKIHERGINRKGITTSKLSFVPLFPPISSRLLPSTFLSLPVSLNFIRRLQCQKQISCVVPSPGNIENVNATFLCDVSLFLINLIRPLNIKVETQFFAMKLFWVDSRLFPEQNDTSHDKV